MGAGNPFSKRGASERGKPGRVFFPPVGAIKGFPVSRVVREGEFFVGEGFVEETICSSFEGFDREPVFSGVYEQENSDTRIRFPQCAHELKLVVCGDCEVAQSHLEILILDDFVDERGRIEMGELVVGMEPHDIRDGLQ